ncbi:hypothetical protein Pan258_52950 [Symmachiella dynata]|uniref:hypothetical protein n=1 Tax=Symmachiella dynata TaxID=2527995 RepID=UPI00118CF6B4|nr:hypothetical protein [Symmachiella dynata]QDT51211.1 hypothetical protein Pan258_52950 [Symmachiella dynata]
MSKSEDYQGSMKLVLGADGSLPRHYTTARAPYSHHHSGSNHCDQRLNELNPTNKRLTRAIAEPHPLETASTRLHDQTTTANDGAKPKPTWK